VRVFGQLPQQSNRIPGAPDRAKDANGGEAPSRVLRELPAQDQLGERGWQWRQGAEQVVDRVDLEDSAREVAVFVATK
jgi:hypothetical protein